MSDDQPLEEVPPTVTSQDEALVFIRESDGFPTDIPGSIGAALGGLIPALNSILPFFGFSIDFNKMLQAILQEVKKKALEQLNQATGGVAGQVINATGLNI
jgi:hypothetical protein